jgi:hypothetical protein
LTIDELNGCEGFRNADVMSLRKGYRESFVVTTQIPDHKKAIMLGQTR